MGSLRSSVELIRCTADAEKLIEVCGREAYGSPPSKDADGAYKWIKSRLQGWEYDVLEHASATFLITCSRVCSHQIVRHRIASYTQQSQRFRETQREDVLLIPEFVKADDITEWLEDYDQAYDVYLKWRGRGYHKQTARYHLPEGIGTRIACTWNFRTLRHIIELRSTKKADPEFRGLAYAIRDICVEKWPAVFDEYAEEA